MVRAGLAKAATWVRDGLRFGDVFCATRAGHFHDAVEHVDDGNVFVF